MATRTIRFRHLIMPVRRIFWETILQKKVDRMASHSGYSTKDGSIVQLTIENVGLSAGDACLIFQVYDGLLSIQDGTCSVFKTFVLK